MEVRCKLGPLGGKSKFLDSLRVHVRGGAGGQGLPRLGGAGGRGGHVIFVADSKTTLKSVLQDSAFTKRFTGGTGTNSRRKYLLGEPGSDVFVKVPIGVCIKTEDGTEVADLNEEGQEAVVARGGEAGNHDNQFLGMKGENKTLILDLKLIADIGLVGFPNAGKSTFLKAVSRTQPKIAEYPFTTIRPQLGTMVYKDHRRITVADLPGLIEGAYNNVGMGHKFLKHVERTKLLLFMIDVSGFQLGHQYQSRTAFQTVVLLNKELELYNPELLKKPAVLAINKIDLDTDNRQTDRLVDLIKNLPDSLSELPAAFHPENVMKFDEIFRISAMFDQNTEAMKERLRKLLDMYADLNDTESLAHMEEIHRLQKLKGLLGKQSDKQHLV